MLWVRRTPVPVCSGCTVPPRGSARARLCCCSDCAFFGLTDAVIEGRWTWEDGTLLGSWGAQATSPTQCAHGCTSQSDLARARTDGSIGRFVRSEPFGVSAARPERPRFAHAGGLGADVGTGRAVRRRVERQRGLRVHVRRARAPPSASPAVPLHAHVTHKSRHVNEHTRCRCCARMPPRTTLDGAARREGSRRPHVGGCGRAATTKRASKAGGTTKARRTASTASCASHPTAHVRPPQPTAPLLCHLAALRRATRAGLGWARR